MKILFLDCDGVLNCESSERYIPGSDNSRILYTGIDATKLFQLKRIVDETEAEIYLTSSWKDFWYKETLSKAFQDDFAYELDDRLFEIELHITDKTSEPTFLERGKGINDIVEQKNPEAWVVLDDEIFPDFEKYGILSRLIKTDWYADGLTAEKADLAIRVLKNEITMEYAASEKDFIHCGK